MTTEKGTKKTSAKTGNDTTTEPKYKDARDRFEQLATKRVRKAVKAIKLIGNLSGPGYEWTPEDAEKIGTALASAVESALNRFESKGSKEEVFNL